MKLYSLLSLLYSYYNRCSLFCKVFFALDSSFLVIPTGWHSNKSILPGVRFRSSSSSLSLPKSESCNRYSILSILDRSDFNSLLSTFSSSSYLSYFSRLVCLNFEFFTFFTCWRVLKTRFMSLCRFLINILSGKV
jgi:hypothetical protein